MSYHDLYENPENSGKKPTLPHKPVSDSKPSSDAPKSKSRRHLIQGAMASGALIAGGGLVYGTKFTNKNSKEDTFENPNLEYGSDPIGSIRSDATDGRVLVVVELAGGNDGLSMVVPYGSGTYYDQRPNVAIPQEEVLTLNDTIGLHPNLARLHQRGITILQGVGSKQNSLSHFDCEGFWQRGDVDGETAYRSGFLARCIDPLDKGAPITGLAVGGHTPYFNSSRSTTIAMSNPGYLNYLSADENWERKKVFHEALRTYGSEVSDSHIDVVHKSYLNLLDMGELAGERPAPDDTNPMISDGGGLGRQLNVAAELIDSDTGVRVVHARLGGFDTHTNQRGRHDQLMTQLDASVAGFLQAAEEKGFADRVLVAVFSEFGRRVSENERGTDHGQASNIILAGAIDNVVMGEVNVADSDDRGNIKTSIPFDSVQRTCAEWLGIEGDSIFPDSDTEILFT